MLAAAARLGLAAALWVAAACAHRPSSSQLMAAGPQPDQAPLAICDGQPLPPSALSPATLTALGRLDDELALRRFAILWGGAEEALAERLLALEAQERGISAAALVQQEIDRRVGEPSDQEIGDLYQAHREAIGAPLAEVAASLRQQWHDDRVAQLRHALVDRLRQAHTASIRVAPPQLSRQQVPPGPIEAQGEATAPVTIVAFGDFQCRFSAQARRLLHRVMQQYPGQVRWFWRSLPLDAEAGHHPAAEAAFCAHEQHRFWPFFDALFDHGAGGSPAQLAQQAAALGLDPAAFHDCIGSLRPRVALMQSQRDADRLGVGGTPALFVNGMAVPGSLPLGALSAIIDRQLAEVAR